MGPPRGASNDRARERTCRQAAAPLAPQTRDRTSEHCVRSGTISVQSPLRIRIHKFAHVLIADDRYAPHVRRAPAAPRCRFDQWSPAFGEHGVQPRAHIRAAVRDTACKQNHSMYTETLDVAGCNLQQRLKQLENSGHTCEFGEHTGRGPARIHAPIGKLLCCPVALRRLQQLQQPLEFSSWQRVASWAEVKQPFAHTTSRLELFSLRCVRITIFEAAPCCCEDAFHVDDADQAHEGTDAELCT
eukprot:SAG11_NODE_691_length_7699_cov_3.868026_2_plen_244_part_00